MSIANGGAVLNASTSQENRYPNPLAQISSALLKAELTRRLGDDEDFRPECGSGGVKGSYNTPLHVFALFLILFLSVLGTVSPLQALT